jgi:hypothetical protein
MCFAGGFDWCSLCTWYSLTLSPQVDNEALASEDKVCLQLHTKKEGKWKHSVSGLVIEDDQAAQKLTQHLRDGVADSIVDFDDHFDNVAKDWRNLNIV